MAGEIGMDDAAFVVDQEHACRQGVETVGESRRLHSLELDRLADQQRTPHVRDEEGEPPSRVVVDDPVIDVAKHPEAGAGDWRLVEIGKKRVDQSLRTDPFLGEARAAEFVAWKILGDRGMHLFEVEEDRGWKGWIYLAVLVDVELPEMRIRAPAVKEFRGPRTHVMGNHVGRAGADEFARSFEHGGPRDGIERRIIDVADQV
jgi:hypothetical protein